MLKQGAQVARDFAHRMYEGTESCFSSLSCKALRSCSMSWADDVTLKICTNAMVLPPARA